MNIRLLKKIRKRYKWYWNKNIESFVVIDIKKQKVHRFKKASSFISHWVSEHLGFGSCTSYGKRIYKREDFVEYRKEHEFVW
jgi:hypothetical protein